VRPDASPVPVAGGARHNELTDDELVPRYRVDETDDGLVGEEGTFAICSFWIVSALVAMGQLSRAHTLCGQRAAHRGFGGGPATYTVRPAGSGGRYTGRNSATRPLNVRIPSADGDDRASVSAESAESPRYAALRGFGRSLVQGAWLVRGIRPGVLPHHPRLRIRLGRLCAGPAGHPTWLIARQQGLRCHREGYRHPARAEPATPLVLPTMTR
jgi:hypothetical protein